MKSRTAHQIKAAERKKNKIEQSPSRNVTKSKVKWRWNIVWLQELWQSAIEAATAAVTKTNAIAHFKSPARINYIVKYMHASFSQGKKETNCIVSKPAYAPFIFFPISIFTVCQKIFSIRSMLYCLLLRLDNISFPVFSVFTFFKAVYYVIFIQRNLHQLNKRELKQTKSLSL